MWALMGLSLLVATLMGKCLFFSGEGKRQRRERIRRKKGRKQERPSREVRERELSLSSSSLSSSLSTVDTTSLAVRNDYSPLPETRWVANGEKKSSFELAALGSPLGSPLSIEIINSRTDGYYAILRWRNETDRRYTSDMWSIRFEFKRPRDEVTHAPNLMIERDITSATAMRLTPYSWNKAIAPWSNSFFHFEGRGHPPIRAVLVNGTDELEYVNRTSEKDYETLPLKKQEKKKEKEKEEDTMSLGEALIFLMFFPLSLFVPIFRDEEDKSAVKRRRTNSNSRSK